MAIHATYVHTNLIARNWRRLADFYEKVLGCRPVPPERALSGAWLEKSTGLPGAVIRGVHLRLPGYGDGGPTLEIFQYEPEEKRQETAINHPGYGHLAFAVDDVEKARDAVIAAGGQAIGDMTDVEIPGAGRVVFVYVADPEGNIIELQHWRK
jgi:catechol 2,3-dioxygenase-like lactoylglutathione lyase family enzyme